VTEPRLDVTDELLVAYVDDELDADQRAIVRSAMAGNPAVRRRAAEMRLSRELLCEAYPLEPKAIVPAGIEAAADRLAEACAGSPRPTRLRWKYAIAASVLLGLVTAAIFLALRPAAGSHESSVTALMRIDPDTPLHAVLETRPSAELIQASGEEASLRAVLTFRAKDGRYCREFDILAGAAGSTGVACREQGGWRAEVLVSHPATPAPGNYYTPAAYEEDSTIERVVDRLIQGDPLSAQEEAQAMANGWRGTGEP